MPRISRILGEELPDRVGEFPVRFPVTWDSSVCHKVEVATVAEFAASRLGVYPTGGLSVLDWLTLTGQGVLEVTAGPVFTDRTRTLAAVRALLAWYPRDVELYVLAAGWQRLCQLLPTVGRTAEAGDVLGSRLLNARLAKDVLLLAFTVAGGGRRTPSGVAPSSARSPSRPGSDPCSAPPPLPPDGGNARTPWLPPAKCS